MPAMREIIMTILNAFAYSRAKSVRYIRKFNESSVSLVESLANLVISHVTRISDLTVVKVHHVLFLFTIQPMFLIFDQTT